MALADPPFDNFDAGQGLTFDYLAQEVYRGLPAKMTLFLTATATTDSFTPSLAATLLDWELYECRQLISTIVQRNLFLSGDHGETYRYHALFRHFLRHQSAQKMPAKTIQNWHQRASHWFKENGEIELALTHALAGNLPNSAGELAKIISEKAWLTGELDKLRQWLAALPANIIQQHPRLCLYQSWVAMQEKAYMNATYWLETAETKILDSPKSAKKNILSRVTSLHSIPPSPQPYRICPNC